MDHFGIGHTFKMVALMYQNCARRTGRTTSLVESLKNGDRVCFATVHEADRVKRLCQIRGVGVRCLVVPLNYPERTINHTTSAGRTLFDHGWIEQYYQNAIDRCAREIDELQKQASIRALPERGVRSGRSPNAESDPGDATWGAGRSPRVDFAEQFRKRYLTSNFRLVSATTKR